MTTRGLGAGEMKEIAELIALAFKNPANTKVKHHISGCVREITSRFPLYETGTTFTS
jgi:glycine hydroxymethyltransferase